MDESGAKIVESLQDSLGRIRKRLMIMIFLILFLFFALGAIIGISFGGLKWWFIVFLIVFIVLIAYFLNTKKIFSEFRLFEQTTSL